jgi:hypothetical protein
MAVFIKLKDKFLVLNKEQVWINFFGL